MSDDGVSNSVAVIGQGFVGGSLTEVLSERGFNVFVRDKLNKVAPGGIVIPVGFTYPVTIYDFVEACERRPDFSRVYFVCLPTPMYEDGEADVSIVEGVLRELSDVESDSPRIAVVKSTVPPGSTERWNAMFNHLGLYVVFNPEFLTEANAVNDMRNQNRIILGGPRPHINVVKTLFQRAFPNVPVVKTSSTTAEFIKYFTNVHLAARVVLSCELQQVCQALDDQGLNVDYDKVVEYARYDQRLGNSHMNVPGPDGIAGARGHCFPKDLAALISVAKGCNVKPTVMSAVQAKNMEIVPPRHRDWEAMHDRAVSKRAKA